MSIVSHRPLARLLLAAGLTVAITGPPSVAAGAAAANTAIATGGPSAPTASAYSWPLAGAPIVLRAFQPPATAYGAGNRGVDLSASPGTVVYAAGAGTVTFAGPVAGRGVVVISHADGVSTEYEPITTMLELGQSVARGDPIGQLANPRAACAPASCLHWGARHDGAYIDPVSLLTALGGVRLIAWSSR